MLQIVKFYFSIQSWRQRFNNRKLSFFCFFDSSTFLSAKARICRFSIIRNSRIGHYSYLGPHSNLNNVEIGKYCSISKNVNIGLGTHPISWVSTSPIFFSPLNGTKIKWVEHKSYDDSPKPTKIGNDVWIGMNVTIVGGVTIGDGAIIGSHALVTQDVKPYMVVGGIPAKPIKNRFDNETIEKLIQLKWWDLDERLIKDNVDLFTGEIDRNRLSELEKLTHANNK